MTVATSQPQQPQRPHVKRWTKAEWLALMARGVFSGQRVFLHRGELIQMPPMGQLHAVGLMNVSNVLFDLFRPQHMVRIQMPFVTPGQSVPEPDAAVCTLAAAARAPHPSDALLIVEVSDSSLDLDHDKADEYAAARVPEYWVLDVAGRVLEVYRDPVADAAQPLGYRYASHQVHGATASIAPVSQPTATVKVADLLP